jgi:Rod binding domain-containing protein
MDALSPLGGAARAQAAQGQSQLDRLQGLGGDDREYAAQEMERLFAQMLVKELRSGLSTGVFGDGPGADTYSAWFDEHLGNELADSGVLGLAGRLRVALGAQDSTALGAQDSTALGAQDSTALGARESTTQAPNAQEDR